MKKWHLHLVAGIVGAALGIAGVIWWRGGFNGGGATGPTPGTSIEELVEALQSPDPAVSSKAEAELIVHGDDAIPRLLELRKNGEIHAHRRAVAVLIQLGPKAAEKLTAALPGERVETGLVRMGNDAVPPLVDRLVESRLGPDAARLLGTLGPKAKPGIPDLIRELLGAQPVSAEAALTLGRIGPLTPEVIPSLTKALKLPNAKVRQRSAEGLGFMGDGAKEAVQDLAGAASDRDRDASAAACWALGRIGDARALPALMDELQRGEEREAAARAIIRLGPAAGNAVPSLTRLALKPDDTLAVRVVVRLGATATPALIQALEGPRPLAEKLRLVEILGAIGTEAEEAAPALTRLLKSEDPELRRTAAIALTRVAPTRCGAAIDLLKWEVGARGVALALGDLGPDARAAIPELIAGLGVKPGLFRPDRRVEMQEALARIGGPALPALILAVKKATPVTAPRAAEVLGWIGPAAGPAVPVLREALERNDESWEVYLSALGLIGRAAREASPELVLALKDPKKRAAAAIALARVDPSRAGEAVTMLLDDEKFNTEANKFAIITTLGQMGPAARGAVRNLRVLLNEGKEGPLLKPIIWALGEIGPDAANAVPDLMQTLRINNNEIGRDVVQALVKIGPGALPALEQSLRDKKNTRRDAAAAVLSRMNQLAPDTILALAEALGDPDRVVRLLAADALGSPSTTAAKLAQDKEEILYKRLSDAMNQDDTELRVKAARALIARGPFGEKAAILFTECLLDPDRAVRQLSAEGLGQLKTDAKYSTAALRSALADLDEGVCLAAADALRRLDPARVSELVPVLSGLLRSIQPDIQLGAIEVLAEIDANAARAALVDLKPEMRSDFPIVRLRFARMFIRLEPMRTRDLLPLLREALGHRDAFIRQEAAVLLGSIGPNAKETAGALAALLRDVNEEVRKAAGQALRKVDPEMADEARVA